ncbi:O-antigen ligase family protein [Burkholderia multivorans]|uniref:O-antigen ligase family protein n=1 Tax=Burkholderia multivorans TaxID=87883 RepID=UPI001C239887|nr:O-antigen ligase family protein [Burkholderia multivorans]MBU9135528.1 O-antigen ligase family protein [Burkholderia multivorans]
MSMLFDRLRLGNRCRSGSLYGLASGRRWDDLVAVLAAGLGVAGYLSWRGATNAALFVLLLLALLNSPAWWANARDQWRRFVPLWIALAAPIVALAIGQLFRQEWIPKAFDAPLRMLLAIPILLYFHQRRIDFARIVGYAAPLCLFAMLAEVWLDPAASGQWGGRYATYFVDTDTFGVYGLVLTGFCLFSLRIAPNGGSKISAAWQLFGALVGIVLIIGSGTRTAWYAVPVVFALWLWLNRRSARLRWLLVCIAVLAAVLVLDREIAARLLSGYHEIHQWLVGTRRDTSAGLRLTMWHMSWELFKHRPWGGYGDTGYLAFLDQPWIASIAPISQAMAIEHGPHNELLANLLRSGVGGGVAVLCQFLIPLMFFARRCYAADDAVKEASRLGLIYIVCVIVMSVGFEMFTLKYTASFYGLVIACLGAQVLAGEGTAGQAARTMNKAAHG